MPFETYALAVVGQIPQVVYLTPGAEEILIHSPAAGYTDDAGRAQSAVLFQQQYARRLGRKCGLIYLLDPLVAQDAEARRIYSTGTPADLFYGVALVADTPLARAIGVFSMCLTRVDVPTRLVDSLNEGLYWLKAIHVDTLADRHGRR